MENVVLVIHLILSLGLIGIVLLQRSEGGGLGIGGGAGGMMSARSAATVLGKATWIIAAAFITTSIALTIIAAEKSAGSSVLDRISDQPLVADPATDAGTTDLGADLLPPTSAESGPVVPLIPAADAAAVPAADATVTEPVATTEPAATN